MSCLTLSTVCGAAGVTSLVCFLLINAATPAAASSAAPTISAAAHVGKATANPAIAAAILAALAVGGLAQRQIGGHTGDVLGACQQAVEIVVVLVLVMLPWNP